MRASAVSRMTIPMLLVHRTAFDTRRGRRGAASSHSATRTKTHRNALKRICGSKSTMRSGIVATPLHRQSFPVRVKDTGGIEATATCTRPERRTTDSGYRFRIAASSVSKIENEFRTQMADQSQVREVLRAMTSNCSGLPAGPGQPTASTDNSDRPCAMEYHSSYGSVTDCLNQSGSIAGADPRTIAEAGAHAAGRPYPEEELSGAERH